MTRPGLRRVWAFAAILLVLGAAAPVAGQPGRDPLARLPGEVAAILDPDTAPRLLLVEQEHGVSNTRTLQIGDEYRDGWRIAAVTPTQVTLRRGREERSVPLGGGSGAEKIEAEFEGPHAMPLAITNAIVGGARPGERAEDADRDGIQSAIAEIGDPQARLQELVALAAAEGHTDTSEFLARFGDTSDGSRIVPASTDAGDPSGAHSPALMRIGPDGRPSMLVTMDLSQMFDFNNVNAAIPPPQSLAD